MTYTNGNRDATANRSVGRPLRFGQDASRVFRTARSGRGLVRMTDFADEAAFLGLMERRARRVLAAGGLEARPESPTPDSLVDAFDRYSMEIRDAAAQAMAPLVREMYPDSRFDRLQPALFDVGGGRRIGWAYETRGDAGAGGRVEGSYFVGDERRTFQAWERLRARASCLETLRARRPWEDLWAAEDALSGLAADGCLERFEGFPQTHGDDGPAPGGWLRSEAFMEALARIETPELRPFPLLLFVLEWLRLPKLRRVGERDALLCSPAVMQAVYGAPIAPALAGVDRVNGRAGLLDEQAASWPPARFLAQAGAPAKERVKKLGAFHRDGRITEVSAL